MRPFILFAVGLAAMEAEKRSYPQEGRTTLERLQRSGAVGTDKSFRSVLEAGKLASNHTAPDDLRKFLAAFRIVRMELVQGYRYDRGRTVLFWWSSEIGFEGDEKTLRERVRETLATLGFRVTETQVRGRPSFQCSKEGKGSVQWARLRGPSRWVGGRKAVGGFEVLWEVRDLQKTVVSRLDQVWKAIPALRPADRPEAFYSSLEKTEPIRVGLGGPWTGSYEWSALFYDAKILPRLEKLLKEMSYRLVRTEADYRLYEKGRGSFAYLHSPDAEGHILFRISLR